jgi:hypothetical protein
MQFAGRWLRAAIFIMWLSPVYLHVGDPSGTQSSRYVPGLRGNMRNDLGVSGGKESADINRSSRSQAPDMEACRAFESDVKNLWDVVIHGSDQQAADAVIDLDPSDPLIRAIQQSPAVEPHERLLHCAAARGLELTVKELLRLGLDANIIDSFGNAALHYTARAGDTATVRQLVHGGADANMRDGGGRYAFELAENQGHRMVAAWLLKRTRPPGMGDAERTSLLRRLKGKREFDEPGSESDFSDSTSSQVERAMNKYVRKKRRPETFPVDFEKYLENSSEAIRDAQLDLRTRGPPLDERDGNGTEITSIEGQSQLTARDLCVCIYIYIYIYIHIHIHTHTHTHTHG